MTDLRKAAEMALEALESAQNGMNECYEETGFDFANEKYEVEQAIQALRQALAQPEQEPVAWMTPTGALYRTEDVSCFDDSHTPLYTQPVDTVNTSQERVNETAKREHEPVAWYGVDDYDKKYLGWDKHDLLDEGFAWITPLYTAPPKREWKGLTSDDKHFLLANAWNKEQAFDGFMEAINKFLEEKNT